ncbi:hypothetical protein Slala03_77090 [Streptomyces lavendulae subsp. lavendulae]|nr:hypothetical protein Slala03_77090 [Streptomyces lavendulae subsp. lavendulae]
MDLLVAAGELTQRRVEGVGVTEVRAKVEREVGLGGRSVQESEGDDLYVQGMTVLSDRVGRGAETGPETGLRRV